MNQNSRLHHDQGFRLVSKIPSLDLSQKMSLTCFALGLLLFTIAGFGGEHTHPLLLLCASTGLITIGGVVYIILSQLKSPPGIKHNGIMFSSLTARGVLGWSVGVLFTGFYIIYYWIPDWYVGFYRMMDPLSYALRNEPTQPWFFYGTVYTFAVLITGFRALLKYRHSRYQMIRTGMVMFSQAILAYLIPALLVFFRQPEKYVNYGWPLSYNDLWPGNFMGLIHHPGKTAIVLAIWGLVFTFVLTPVLTYAYGKRWYCSWVCGCGGLANTLGDPWRQLSDKSKRAWDIELISIYSVLILVVLTTAILWISYVTGWVNGISTGLSKFYGFMIGMIFSGVVGVGFYPILGTRVWCRFGCPMAAILGILQRVHSRFRITTNGAQCISCGNCSTYCEMGIDVRAYAEKGENIIRASCVGCGLCSAVCPRGVLNLENGPKQGRYNQSLSLVNEFKAGT